ncbi:hypothetical protein NPIL_235671 [Nephila pilipes]|uniref:Uncharacterized protein n=1 Tax=Nephila pilipes TaxID=299642 RepID=A0A8X6J0Y5_NEPPI|nr:hypothetical protein NPIL_235671 [Nephila pilipes]
MLQTESCEKGQVFEYSLRTDVNTANVGGRFIGLFLCLLLQGTTLMLRVVTFRLSLTNSSTAEMYSLCSLVLTIADPTIMCPLHKNLLYHWLTPVRPVLCFP